MDGESPVLNKDSQIAETSSLKSQVMDEIKAELTILMRMKEDYVYKAYPRQTDFKIALALKGLIFESALYRL